MIAKQFEKIGEYCAMGLYENQDRSLFYRKSVAILRYYENCPLPEYKGDPLYPSGVMPVDVSVFPHYLDGITENGKLQEKNKLLADKLHEDFFRYRSCVPAEHTVAGNMWVHSIPNYERVLAEGILSYKDRINKIKDDDLREGLMNIVKATDTFARRCVGYLNCVGADKNLIAALEKVPMLPASNIYEAVLAWNFTMYLDSCDNLGCVDSGLLPYYNGENIVPLLENLYDNLDANDGYSMALHNDYNPLTVQCLQASKGKRRPMIELFVDENTPDEIWEKAFEVIKTSNGQPAFYNPRVLLPALKKKFPDIRDPDLKKICGGCCTESMLAGLSNAGSLDAGINLLLIFERTLREKLATSKNFEEFLSFYLQNVKDTVDVVTDAISRSQRSRAIYDPVPMRTLLIDDCIDKQTEYYNGGARYRWSIINFAGLINMIDSLFSVKDFVFEQKLFSPELFICKLENNDADFLRFVRSNKNCFGTDNEEVNEFSRRLSDKIFSFLEDKTPYSGGAFIPASIQFMSQADAGRNIGATPDGRESGAPLCDSLGAIFGKDYKGPTALLKSVTSLALDKAVGVPVLNFNISPNMDGKILKALILGYMKLGGIQMQITCASRKVLEDAYKNPELHKNLVVRVGGYSEYFYRLSDDLKRMVINRTIQEENNVRHGY